MSYCRAQVSNKSEEEILAVVKELAVMTIAVCTLPADMTQMSKDHTNPFHHFCKLVS